MQPLDPRTVSSRYGQAVTDLVSRHPDGRVLSTSTATQPFDATFPRAEVFMGSHCDADPKTADHVEVWSSRREADGTETILRETFVQRQERPGLFSRKTDVLNCYVHLLRAPGNVFLDAALCTVDLRTGEVLRSLTGEEAAKEAWDLGVAEDAREFNPAMPPQAPGGFRPTRPKGDEDEPPRPSAEEEVKRQVDALRAPRERGSAKSRSAS